MRDAILPSQTDPQTHTFHKLQRKFIHDSSAGSTKWAAEHGRAKGHGFQAGGNDPGAEDAGLAGVMWIHQLQCVKYVLNNRMLNIRTNLFLRKILTFYFLLILALRSRYDSATCANSWTNSPSRKLSKETTCKPARSAANRTARISEPVSRNSCTLL